ncbi:DNA-binding protein [Pseudomonas sp. CC120222-01a]|uniref:helix-turn-helix domain-containing transcriptional regulator n=1 Tax=Pseudomonas sp. CC120222-01a TaxID=1378075 RepID=UPI002114E660|nr:hypothetical protein [Pseudomonas sp. CC120222-01a]
MTDIKLTRWDAAAHLKTEGDVAAYLEACLEENDPALLAAAQSDITRALEMEQMECDWGGRLASAAKADSCHS